MKKVFFIIAMPENLISLLSFSLNTNGFCYFKSFMPIYYDQFKFNYIFTKNDEN